MDMQTLLITVKGKLGLRTVKMMKKVQLFDNKYQHFGGFDIKVFLLN